MEKFGRNFDSRGGFAQRGMSNKEMFDAVCSDCKKPCKVPFKPTEGKPVYCKECFATMPKPNRF